MKIFGWNISRAEEVPIIMIVNIVLIGSINILQI